MSEEPLTVDQVRQGISDNYQSLGSNWATGALLGQEPPKQQNVFEVGSFSENPFDDIEQKTGGYQYDMPESAWEAATQAMLIHSQSSFYGAGQLAGKSNAKYDKQRKWVNEMEKEFGWPVTAGVLMGQLVDPINSYNPISLGVKGAGTILSKIGKLAFSGAKAGAVSGGLEYIPEGQESILGTGAASRVENAMLGTGAGAALGPVLGAAGKGVAKAYEPLGNMFWKTLGTPTGAGASIGAYMGYEMDPMNEEDRMKNMLMGSLGGAVLFNSPRAIDLAYGKINPGGKISQHLPGLWYTRPGQSWADKNYSLQEGLASWLIPNYGRSQQYVTSLRKMRAAEGMIFKDFDELSNEMRNLNWRERKVLYRMLQGEEYGDIYGDGIDMKKLQGLNDTSRTKIKELGKYLVDIGMLDSKVYAKNADNYLTTSYMKHEFAEFADPMERLNAANLLFHRRGNMQTMSADAFAKGQRPDTLGDWEILDELPLGQVRVRRQWTKDEKKSMQEIEDASYAMAKTGRNMAKEAAMGGFYKSLADAEGIVVKEGTPNAMMLPDRPEWGALRGKHVDKRVYEDLLAMRTIRPQMLGENMWNQLQAITGTWKGLKTIASPVVQWNNVVSSMHMYDLAGGNYSEIPSMAKEIYSKGKLYEQMLEDGVFGSNFVRGELDDVAREVYEAYGASRIRFKSSVAEGLRDAVDITRRIVQNTAGKAWDKAGDFYAMGDDIWRAGLYKTKLDQALGRGMDERSARAFAAEEAAKWFVDYELGTTPLLNAIRKTAMPFFSYTYGTTPRLVEAAVKNPAAYAKWALVYEAMNSMGEDHSGYSDAYFEEFDRMQQPEDKMFGMRFMPNARIAMPSFIADKLFPNAPGPMALNQSRAMPLGTFNMQSTQESPGGSDAGKVPGLPDNLQPNFGLVGAIAGPMMNVNLGFGGKIKEGEIGKTIMKNILPNWQFFPGTYATEKKEKADALAALGPGETNLYADDWSPTTATLSNIGPRFEVIDNDKLGGRLRMQFTNKINEKKASIRSIMRDPRYRLESERQGGKGRYHQKIEKLEKEIEKILKDMEDKGLL